MAKKVEARTRKHGVSGIAEESEFATVPGWEGGAEEERPLLDISCFSGGLLAMLMWVWRDGDEVL